jgi:hypothetical protein
MSHLLAFSPLPPLDSFSARLTQLGRACIPGQHCRNTQHMRTLLRCYPCTNPQETLHATASALPTPRAAMTPPLPVAVARMRFASPPRCWLLAPAPVRATFPSRAAASARAALQRMACKTRSANWMLLACSSAAAPMVSVQQRHRCGPWATLKGGVCHGLPSCLCYLPSCLILAVTHSCLS